MPFFIYFFGVHKARTCAPVGDYAVATAAGKP